MGTHKRLVLPGPVEVREEILQAQTQWMIGHRSTAFADLYARMQVKLKQAFKTENRVILLGSSGTGLWEGASRNCIRDDKKVLHLIGGAFSERWAEISQMNGKQVDTIKVEWGQAHTAQMVADAMAKQTYDAVCAVHNETSTGVTNPIKAIGEVVRQYEDTLFLVDTVSGFLGAELRTDDWGIDFALTSSQKAFALPPGIAFCAVSDRAMAKAKTVPARGYYFDFISLAKSIAKNQTPATPAVSLLFALDRQLDDIMAEGMENRFTRHLAMRDRTLAWARGKGFEIFAAPGFESPTVTCASNNLGIDISALNKYLRGHGMIISNGYGDLKGKTFRIAHMGDTQMHELEELFGVMDGFFA